MSTPAGIHRGIFTIDASAYLNRAPGLEVEPLAPGLWTVSGGGYRTLFAEGDEGVVALNTFGTPAGAAAYRQAVESAAPGKPIHTLVCTIDHLDHAGFSANLAPNAQVVAHELTAEVISGRGADGQLPATKTVGREGDTLELDGVPLRLIYPGPTQGTGNLAVYFPDHRVLFMVGPQADARYGLFPDFHIEHYVASVRSLFDLDFDTFVPGRYGLMRPEDLRKACDYFEAIQVATQEAFAVGVPVWDIDLLSAFVAPALKDRFGDLDGFHRHLPIGALRIVHHYLMGGWGLEDTAMPELVYTRLT